MQIRLLVHTLMSQEAPSHIVGGGVQGGQGSSNYTKISEPMQNDISKHCTKSQKCSSKITKVTKSQSFHKCFLGVLGVFRGVRVIRFLPKFRIPCRMILVNTVPIPKPLALNLQRLYDCKVFINGGWTTNKCMTTSNPC